MKNKLNKNKPYNNLWLITPVMSCVNTKNNLSNKSGKEIDKKLVGIFNGS
jgi:hypothetical protein